MLFIESFKKRCGKILHYWGRAMQIDMFVEEASELIKELCKFKRGRDNRKEIISEVADVYITLEQITQMFNIGTVELLAEINTKLSRAEEYIKKEMEDK